MNLMEDFFNYIIKCIKLNDNKVFTIGEIIPFSNKTEDKNKIVLVWKDKDSILYYQLSIFNKSFTPITNMQDLLNIINNYLNQNYILFDNFLTYKYIMSLKKNLYDELYDELYTETYGEIIEEYYDVQKEIRNHILKFFDIKYFSEKDIAVISKESFNPYIKKLFFLDSNKLLNKNTYIPSTYMYDDNNITNNNKIKSSKILEFILNMAKFNISNAIDILIWLSNIFKLNNESKSVLVLKSSENKYIDIFYEEIVSPLLNSKFCSKITEKDLDNDSLVSKLDKKILYYFHNIISPKILDIPITDFLTELIQKDEFKKDDKTITTIGNILVSSTNNCIPLINKYIECLEVEVSVNLEYLRDVYIINIIRADLYNFSLILKSLDFDTIISQKKEQYNQNTKSFFYQHKNNPFNINEYSLSIFYKAIINKDINFFEKIKDNNDLAYQELIDDFNKDRIKRSKISLYFISIFKIYKYNNTKEILAGLREIKDKKYNIFSMYKNRNKNISPNLFKIANTYYYRLKH